MPAPAFQSTLSNAENGRQPSRGDKEPNVFHRYIHTVHVPVNVWRCPWQHRLLHHGPKEAQVLLERSKTGQRGGWHTSLVPHTVLTGKPTVCPHPEGLFLRGYLGICRLGASWDWTEGRVCACSHISFHSFTLQKAPDSVKILALSYSQSIFEAGTSTPAFQV